MTDVERVLGMTREEWDALGNPPGSWEATIEMAEENSRTLRRATLTPHPWDAVDEGLADRELRDAD
jgi:hypothetical protein